MARKSRAEFQLDRYTYGGEVWRVQDQPHHVYVIAHEDGGCVGPVKVGLSYAPFSRLKEVQAGNPRLLAVYENIQVRDKYDARTLELAFHTAFAAQRIRGEWFNVEPEAAAKWLQSNIPVVEAKVA